MSQVLQCHLNIILKKRTNFVGTKTLCAALKTVQIGLKYKPTRMMIQDHINVILYEISLPLMLLNQGEYELWTENPIEYVRMQVDQSNPNSAKHIVKVLVKVICGIKPTRTRISPYLESYLQVLVNNLQQETQDFRVKEAILHSLGNLAEQIGVSNAMMASMEPIL